MKIVKYISAICLSLLVFSACDSDLDKYITMRAKRFLPYFPVLPTLMY